MNRQTKIWQAFDPITPRGFIMWVIMMLVSAVLLAWVLIQILSPPHAAAAEPQGFRVRFTPIHAAWARCAVVLDGAPFIPDLGAAQYTCPEEDPALVRCAESTGMVDRGVPLLFQLGCIVDPAPEATIAVWQSELAVTLPSPTVNPTATWTPSPGPSRTPTPVVTVTPDIPASEITLCPCPSPGPSPGNLALRGFLVARVTAPKGLGARSLEVLRNGVVPSGSTDPTLQYDTFTGTPTTGDDWIGVRWSTQEVVHRITWQEGLEFPDGGWFTSAPRIEAQVGPTWVPLNCVWSPAYVPHDGVPWETYSCTPFIPVGVSGIRVIGRPGGTSTFISMAELEVW